MFEFYTIFIHQTHLQLINYHDHEKNSLFTRTRRSDCTRGIMQQLRRRRTSPCEKASPERYHAKANTKQGRHDHNTNTRKKDDLGHFIYHQFQFA